MLNRTHTTETQRPQTLADDDTTSAVNAGVPTLAMRTVPNTWAALETSSRRQWRRRRLRRYTMS